MSVSSRRCAFSVKVSATGRSLVQRRPTECVCVCVSLNVTKEQQYPSAPKMSRYEEGRTSKKNT